MEESQMNPLQDDNNYSLADKVFIYIDDSEPDSKTWESGGICQDQKNDFRNRSYTLEERKPRKGGEVMGELRNVIQNLSDVEKANFNPFILDPEKYNSLNELLDALEHWWIYFQRGSESTFKKRKAIIKRFSKHPIYPIDPLNIKQNQAMLYLYHREHIEKAGVCAIHNEWDTIAMLCNAFGIDYLKWNYKPPSRPPSKQVIIPLPSMVHKIIHHKYVKDKYLNTLIQYILTIGFTLGLRPSELVILKLSDIHLDEGYIIVTEPKKHNQRRQVFVEYDILNNPRRKSFKNYIEHWRPTTDNDYLFVQANGRPFTVAYLRKVITPLVKQVYPEFHLYMMRHWCAIARLIRSYIKTGNWDKTDVQDWLGHDKVSTTGNYTKFAKKYYLMTKYDWIEAILKSPKSWREENSQKSIKHQKTLLSSGTNRSSKVRTWRRINRFSPVDLFDKIANFKGIDFSASLIKPFFFSFYCLFANSFLSLFFQRKTADSPQRQDLSINKTRFLPSFPEGDPCVLLRHLWENTKDQRREWDAT